MAILRSCWPVAWLMLCVLVTWAAGRYTRSFDNHISLLNSIGQQTSVHRLQSSMGVRRRLVPLAQNSPVYYIKLAPSSHVTSKGTGFLNRPQKERPFFSVPFRSNARPASIHQLTPTAGSVASSYAVQHPQKNSVQEQDKQQQKRPYVPSTPSTTTTSSTTTTTTTTKKPTSTVVKANSPVTWLKGNFLFDGRPNGSISVLKRRQQLVTLLKMLATSRRKTKLDHSMWSSDP